MSDADDLARRFFALWADYLAALMADPKTAEPLRAWLTAAGATPGLFSAEGEASGPTRSPAGAAAAAGSSGGGDVAVAELARRIDQLAERVAELERGAERRRRAPAGPRRRNRTTRN